MLEILDLGRRGIVLYVTCSKNKGANQLLSYCEADLRLCFRIGKIPVFSWRGSYDLAVLSELIIHKCNRNWPLQQQVLA